MANMPLSTSPSMTPVRVEVYGRYGKLYSVEALLVPPFAIHKAINAEGWEVTHLPTGCGTWTCPTEDQARCLAEWLALEPEWLALTEGDVERGELLATFRDQALGLRLEATLIKARYKAGL